MAGRGWLAAGAILGGTGVALGAFGAHSLSNSIHRLAADPAEQQRLLEVWEVAVRYQMFHALAICVVGLIRARYAGKLLGSSAACMAAGTLIFSGLLYALVLTGVKILGAIVPIGGTLMIVGWALLAIWAMRAADRHGDANR